MADIEKQIADLEGRFGHGKGVACWLNVHGWWPAWPRMTTATEATVTATTPDHGHDGHGDHGRP